LSSIDGEKRKSRKEHQEYFLCALCDFVVYLKQIQSSFTGK